MNKRRKSGFSIMETVIALAVIVLVTAAALSVVMASISSRIKQSNYSEAQDFAHNIIECYKAAHDPVEFVENAGFAGIELIQNDSNYYKCTTSRFTAEIEVDFSLTGSLDMDIYVNSNSNNDENKLSFTYTKGAK